MKRNDNRLLTREEVEDEFGISKRFLEIEAMRGAGPPIVRLSPRMVRYRVSDIESWIEARTVNPADRHCG